MAEVESEDVLSDQNVSEPYNVTQEDVKFQEDLATLMTIGKSNQKVSTCLTLIGLPRVFLDPGMIL